MPKKLPIFLPFKETLLAFIRTSHLTQTELEAVLIQLRIYENQLWNTALEHAAQITDIGIEYTDKDTLGSVSQEYSKRIRVLKNNED